MVIGAGMMMATLVAAEMEQVVDTASKFSLDFDDAYQYVVAEKYGLMIVSLDHDFDRTARGRKEPADVV
jgi:uncharacterized protein